MSENLPRRTVLGAALLLPLVACAPPPRAPAPAPPAPGPDTAADQFSELEHRFDARLGLYALHVGTGRELAHRADERFALCSTFKVLTAAAVLDRNPPEHLETRIRYRQGNLVAHSPITGKHVGNGMTIRELCDAAIRYSDNTAGNLLLDDLGGPAQVTAFVRTLGDGVTRLDRRETELNSAVPGDVRDTTTARAIAADYRALVLGNRLDAPERALLAGWMLANTTGDARIRAGVPATWRVADKTGAGGYASINDVAIVYPPDSTPIVLSVLTSRASAAATGDDALLAQAASVAAAELS